MISVISVLITAQFKLCSKLLVIMWSRMVDDVFVTLVGLVIKGTAPLLIIVLIYSFALGNLLTGHRLISNSPRM